MSGFTTLASKTIRVADWYVQLEQGLSVKLVNETYSILVIDQKGWVDWNVTLGRKSESSNPAKIPTGDASINSKSSLTVKTTVGSWLPNADEREALNRLAFGPGTRERWEQRRRRQYLRPFGKVANVTCSPPFDMTSYLTVLLSIHVMQGINHGTAFVFDLRALSNQPGDRVAHPAYFRHLLIQVM